MYLPVEQTIDVILGYVYENRNMAPLDIPRDALKALLFACTKEVPFRCPEGKLYYQVDGVAMGSPLGVLFANAYMCHVEEKVLADNAIKPHMYYRYVDDIFVDVASVDDLEKLKRSLTNESCLNFTAELNVGNKLPFLDLMIDSNHEQFDTDVYVKPTNLGRCMNAAGDCNDAYKRGVIRSYVKRALTHCSTWNHVHRELVRVRQMLINNGYSNTDFDSISRDMINRHVDSDRATETDQIDKIDDIAIFYRNTITPSWKTDEKVIRDIVMKNAKPTEPHKRIQLRIYYKTPKTSSLVIHNNTRKTGQLKETDVVYKFRCTSGDCETRNVYYIGHTTTSLSRRLTMHLQDGGPKAHVQNKHNTRLTRDILTTNTTIIMRCHDKRRLAVAETIFIRETAPVINAQTKTLTSIPLYDRRLH